MDKKYFLFLSVVMFFLSIFVIIRFQNEPENLDFSIVKFQNKYENFDKIVSDNISLFSYGGMCYNLNFGLGSCPTKVDKLVTPKSENWLKLISIITIDDLEKINFKSLCMSCSDMIDKQLNFIISGEKFSIDYDGLSSYIYYENGIFENKKKLEGDFDSILKLEKFLQVFLGEENLRIYK